MTALLDGLFNPLLVPTHFMAVAALALLTSQQGWGLSVAVVYTVAILAGLGAIALAYVPALAPEALLVTCAMTGLLVALGRRLPLPAGLLLAAALGCALALDAPPEAISLRDANLTLLGTAVGATALLLVLVEFMSFVIDERRRIAARIIGSWIAASAILALALRLVR